ncbi:DUF2267 domain-containing protein [Nitrosophilus alvini]|uniref:DUF2267 domain-containing protein n=1 Tax=Nitrosophilus alvini TaxID=2714855 RepID=UPI00190C28A7|nr:DUF2267 domain-containing protein [Nitrosophilus alvini]
MNFEKNAQVGNEFLKEVAIELGHPGDINRGGRVLRSVLRVLRRKISPDEYLDLISQLPMCIKAVAVDGWKLTEFPDKSIKNVDDFIKAITEEDKRSADNDFGDENQAKEAVKAVFRVIKKHVSEGEIKDLEAELPKVIKEFIEEA